MTRDDLLSRIAALRGRVRRLLAIYGLARVSAVFLGILLFAGWADWAIHLAAPLRVLEFLATTVVIGWAARKFILRPFLANFDDLSLALRIEERWPGLQDRLASAVEFLEQANSRKSSDNASPELRQHVINQAFAEVASINFAEAIEPRPVRQSLKFLGIAMSIALVSVILGPQSSKIAMARFFNPINGPDWPKATQMNWVEASPKVAIGEPWSLVVKVQEGFKVPDSAVAEFTFEDGEKAEEPLRIVEGGEFRGRIESVSQSFSVRVRAGDDLTENKQVEAVTPPRITDITIQIEAPSYTGLMPVTLAPGSAQIRAVQGSIVKISAKVSKSLGSANLTFTDSSQSPPKITIDESQQNISVEWTASAATGISFDLTDLEGFTSKDQSRLDQQVVLDNAPRVVLEDPATDREITAQTVLPLKVDLEDDFGIHQVRMKYAISTGSGEPGEPLSKALWTAVANEPLVKKNKIQDRWDIAPLGLTPGSMITLSIEATDFKAPDGPNVGKSREIRLRIITPEEAARQMEDQRREIREETERVLAMQRQANRPVDETRRTLAQTQGQMPEAGKQELQNAEQIQKQVGDRINNPNDGLTRKVERFMEDLDNLKLQNPEAAEQMQGLKNALAQLEQGALPQAEQALNRANRAINNRGNEPGQTSQSRSQPNNADSQKAANSPDQPQLKNENTQSKQGDSAKPKDSPQADQESALRKASDLVKGKNAESGQSKQATAPGQNQSEQAKAGQQPQNQGEQAKAGQQPQNHGEQAKAGQQTQNQGEQAKASQDAKPQSGQQQAQNQNPMGQQPDSKDSQTPTGQADQSLAQAQNAQRQITNSLEQMLGEMSQLESVRGLINDAKQLANAQQELNKAVEEAAVDPELMGKNAENIPAEKKAGLENQAARQNDLAKQLRDLQQRLGEMANRMADQDPLDAAGLQEAADNSRNQGTSGKMNQAAEQIAKNQANAARQTQEQAAKEVQQLVDDIQNRKEKELARLVKQLKQAEQEMRDLKRAQVENLLKTREAGNMKDEAQRKAELQKLARQEQQLQEEARRQLQKLQRMRSTSQAAQAGQQAAGQMGQAQQKMDADDADGAQENQEEALKNLDEAEQQLAQARQEAEEQLAQEQFTKMADLIKSLAERQSKMVEDTLGYDKKKSDTGDLTLAQKAGVRNLGLVEDSLKQETVELAQRMDDGVPVFSLILKKAADQMNSASQGLQKLETGQPTQTAEKTAAERLQQLIDSLQPDKPKDGQQQQQQQQGEGQQGGDQEGDGIPTVAQLKMLKRLQSEINQRTGELDNLVKAGDKLNAQQQSEMENLKVEQGRLADLLRDLSKPKRSDGED